MAIYIPPKVITDERILPSTTLSSSWIGSVINLDGSPGEFRPATFIVRPSTNITGMTITPSVLSGAGIIPTTNIDIRVVKCWWQDLGIQAAHPYNSGGADYVGQKTLTPELLLHDDSIIQVDTSKNYVKTIDGVLHDVTNPDDSGDNPAYTNWQIRDAATLQAVNISANTNKQFWLTVKIPANATPGSYTGTITLSTGEVINVNLTVHPINLMKSYLEYSIYNQSKISSGGGLGESRTIAQITKELQNLIDHGCNNPNCYEPYNVTNLTQLLNARQSVGMGNTPFYYLGFSWGNPTISQIPALITLLRSYGYTDIYLYGIDEAHGTALSGQLSTANAVRAAGGKYFASCWLDDYIAGGNVLDLAVIAYYPTPNPWYPSKVSQVNEWHKLGRRAFLYAAPQGGPEYPETWRKNYGLLLYQRGYDGCMTYAYYAAGGGTGGNGYNDFDQSVYKDEMMVYPTIDGVIDTLQWEGFREANVDTRYLTTLMNVINTTTKDKTAAVNFLNSLATVDISPTSTTNMDSLRATMIAHILNLQGAATAPAVSTQAATNLAQTSARLNGNLSSLGDTGNVQVSFQWGTSPGVYPNETTPLSMAAIGGFYADITSLAPNTAYYFRAKVVGGSTVYGNELSLTTLGGTPVSGTFGYAPTVAPVSNTSSVTKVRANIDPSTIHLAGANERINKLSIFSWGSGTGRIVHVGVYEMLNGLPRTLIQSVPITVGPAGWHDSAPLNIPLTQGKTYCLADDLNNDSFTAVYYDAKTGNTMSQDTSPTGNLMAATWDHNLYESNLIAMYATYETQTPTGLTHGVSYPANVTLLVTPSGKICKAEVLIGTSPTAILTTSAQIQFTSTGANQQVPITTMMPPAAGTYQVYVKIYYQGNLLNTLNAGSIVVS